jgi:hypothetical protein
MNKTHSSDHADKASGVKGEKNILLRLFQILEDYNLFLIAANLPRSCATTSDILFAAFAACWGSALCLDAVV